MWPNPQETANLVTFTEEIFNGKLHFSSCVYDYLFSKTKLLNPPVTLYFIKMKNGQIYFKNLVVSRRKNFKVRLAIFQHYEIKSL